MRIWWMELLEGSIAVVFGLFLLTFPHQTLTLIIVLFGLYIAVEAALHLVSIATRRVIVRRAYWDIAVSCANLAVGILFLVRPNAGTIFFLLLLAGRIGVQIIAELRTALRSQSRLAGMYWTYAFGLIAVLLLLFVAGNLRTLFYWFIALTALLDGILLLTRGVVLWRAPARIQRVMSQFQALIQATTPPDPALRRAIVFVRRTGANGLGHVGWAFEWPNGRFNAGSIENVAGKPFAAVAEMDFWASHVADPVPCMRDRDFPYDEYKIFLPHQPQPHVAWRTVIWESRTPYSLIHHNCNDVVYDVLRAYGVENLLDPAEEYVPNDWYDALRGPSFTIADHPTIDQHIFRQNTQETAFTDRSLTIPARLTAEMPPWRQSNTRVYVEMVAIWRKMLWDLRSTMMLVWNMRRMISSQPATAAITVETPQSGKSV